jgi:hypothetical protein
LSRDLANPVFRLERRVITAQVWRVFIGPMGDIARHAFTTLRSALRETLLPPGELTVAGESK